MKKILVIDDSSFMREIIKHELKKINVTIIEGKNGRDAVKLFKEHQPDLVTMDIVMPFKTGFEALEEMLSINPKAKIIICSSLVNERTDKEAREKGAIEFIKKPFQNSDFIEIIQKHLF